MFNRIKPGVIALFAKIHELRANPVDQRHLALIIQEDLLRRVAQAERQIRKLRADNKVIGATLASRGLDKASAQKLKKHRTYNAERVERCKSRLALYGVIGDALAFIYADRWDLKPLCKHEEVGFLTGKRGARLERKVLRRVFASGKAAVLNDLTNSLRFGDLTCFLRRAHSQFWK